MLKIGYPWTVVQDLIFGEPNTVTQCDILEHVVAVFFFFVFFDSSVRNIGKLQQASLSWPRGYKKSCSTQLSMEIFSCS